MQRIVVLASGSGSNLQAVIAGCRQHVIDADVVGVVSNSPGAHALTRAVDAGITAELIVQHDGEARRHYDARLADAVASFEARLGRARRVDAAPD